MAVQKDNEFDIVETRQVRFRVLLPPLIGIILRASVPLNGKITEICYHFAPGANQLVMAALRYGTVQISPVEGFISLDNATPIFYVNQPCVTGGDLELELQNTDIVNPHTISCIVTIVGVYNPVKIGDEKK